jgi:hypothetical protein
MKTHKTCFKILNPFPCPIFSVVVAFAHRTNARNVNSHLVCTIIRLCFSTSSGTTTNFLVDTFFFAADMSCLLLHSLAIYLYHTRMQATVLIVRTGLSTARSARVEVRIISSLTQTSRTRRGWCWRFRTNIQYCSQHRKGILVPGLSIYTLLMTDILFWGVFLILHVQSVPNISTI